MTTMTASHDAHPGRTRRRPHLRRSCRPTPPRPVLFLIGSPMGASGFGTLASHFPDRTVVTYDPRGVERSTKADPASPSTPEQHADDLHRIIAALDAGPVDLFASSGGAVNALALVAAHPEQVRTLVAHEPPLAAILPDREGALAATEAIARHVPAQRLRCRHGAVHRRGRATAGPMDAAFLSQPAPDPAMFHLPTEDDGIAHRSPAGPEHHQLHPLRARLRRVAVSLHPHRLRRGRGVGRPDGVPRRLRRGRASGHDAGPLPERPRRLPGRRVRPARRPGRLRREAARGPRRRRRRAYAAA